MSMNNPAYESPAEALGRAVELGWRVVDGLSRTVVQWPHDGERLVLAGHVDGWRWIEWHPPIKERP